MVTVICGAVTVAPQMAGRVVVPLSVRLFVPLKTVSPRKVTLFVMVRAAPPAIMVVLAPMVRRPVPTGPVTTGSFSNSEFVSEAMISPPELIVTPLVKVLAPPS